MPNRSMGDLTSGREARAYVPMVLRCLHAASAFQQQLPTDVLYRLANQYTFVQATLRTFFSIKLLARNRFSFLICNARYVTSDSRTSSSSESLDCSDGTVYRIPCAFTSVYAHTASCIGTSSWYGCCKDYTARPAFLIFCNAATHRRFARLMAYDSRQ